MMYSNHALAPGLKTAPEGEAGSIARRLWPQGIPGSVQFPNIAQVNQLWTVSLEEEGKKQKFLTGSAALTFNDKAQEIDDEETRKQKNRVFAKRSREKRKNQCQQLESEVNALLKQNQDLRNLVQAHIPNKAQSIIKDCCKNHPIHQAAAAAAAAAAAHSDPKDRQKNLDGSDFMLIENLIHSQQSFVLTDPFQADNPIVYASEAFYKLTGYSSDKILGRNCRILQGPDTDLKAVQQIRYNIEQGKDTSVNLLNYKADGTPFWNQFFVAPLRNRDRVIVNYVSAPLEGSPNTHRQPHSLACFVCLNQ